MPAREYSLSISGIASFPGPIQNMNDLGYKWNGYGRGNFYLVCFMKIDHKIETDIGDEMELSLANRTSLLILQSWF